MKNVYDVKRDNNLNFILPKEVQMAEIKTEDLRGNVLVIIHLHYMETIDNYFTYIEAIPRYADIIITTSDNQVGRYIAEKPFKGKDRCRIIYKQNRGRDISSFLVACRVEILKYEYVCFVHDKKERNEKFKTDTDKWVYGLWENSLASTIYINNILLTLINHPKLGLLVPPSPIGEHFSFAYKNVWSNDFELMLQLAERLELNCNLDQEKSPITIGTVFWAKVDALRKLFECEWQYEDFDDEPLKEDGTLSHAIERSFAYAAQDAGYETGWVMTDAFAGERLQYMEGDLEQLSSFIASFFRISSIYDLKLLERQIIELKLFCEEKEPVYIYGAGNYAQRCVLLLKWLNIEIRAFLVTDKSDNVSSLQGYPIKSIDEEKMSGDSAFIVAVSQQYQQQILQQIHKKCGDRANIYIWKYLF